MVGYDDQADALTLGDDDEIRIGDYEIRYNSTSGDWEAVYTPTGDVANVPPNQSGSLFPTDFADALAGQVLADDGNLYSSVQTAVNSATDWAFIGRGTFGPDDVRIPATKDGFTLIGSGYDTLVDGGSAPNGLSASIELYGCNNVTLSNFRVRNDSGSGIDAVATSNGATAARIKNVDVSYSDNYGFRLHTAEHIVTNCRFASCQKQCMNLAGVNHIISGNQLDASASGNSIYSSGSDQSIIGNQFFGTPSASHLKLYEWDDSILLSNRVINAGYYGIQLQSGVDTIIANNRVSDSTNDDIYDGGTNTTLDANKTGPSN